MSFTSKSRIDWKQNSEPHPAQEIYGIIFSLDLDVFAFVGVQNHVTSRHYVAGATNHKSSPNTSDERLSFHPSHYWNDALPCQKTCRTKCCRPTFNSGNEWTIGQHLHLAFQRNEIRFRTPPRPQDR